MKYDLELAHRFSNNHKPELEKDIKCGCFYCLTIFEPSEIEEWIIADNPCDKRGTAICPHCGIDSVIGESSGFPITKEFLLKMKKRWF
ncbi:MAG: cytoplasmic protein [Lachnospiraceae bacterium]|nr:cytoplasmic protein [Lachnospiraceae bacterium]